MLHGKNIIFSSSNMAKAVHFLGKGAFLNGKVILASFSNLRATYEYLKKRLNEKGSHVYILPVGRKGVVGADDMLCAAILYSNLSLGHGSKAVACAIDEGKVYSALKDSDAGKRLSSLGFAGDVGYCSKVDSVKAVPLLKYLRGEIEVTRG